MKNKIALFVKEVLLERTVSGRKLEVASRKLLRKFIQEIKNPEILEKLTNKENVEIIVVSDDVEIPDDKIDFYLLNILFDDDLDNESIETRGEYNDSGDLSSITMDLYFPRKFRVQDISDLYPEILEIFRHELEHAYQEFNEDEKDSPENLTSTSDFEEYYLNRHEVSAFISGLKLKAAVHRKSLFTLIDAKISQIIDTMSELDIPKNEIFEFEERLKSVYFSFAKKKYPSIK